MTKPIALTILTAALALASGTITPGSRPGGARCAVSTMEGSISKLDVENRKFAVAGKGGTREFKVAQDTQFRIPGASKEQLKDAPLSKIAPNSRVKVSYCTKDGSPVEVKIER